MVSWRVGILSRNRFALHIQNACSQTIHTCVEYYIQHTYTGLSRFIWCPVYGNMFHEIYFFGECIYLLYYTYTDFRAVEYYIPIILSLSLSVCLYGSHTAYYRAQRRRCRRRLNVLCVVHIFSPLLRAHTARILYYTLLHGGAAAVLCAFTHRPLHIYMIACVCCSVRRFGVRSAAHVQVLG